MTTKESKQIAGAILQQLGGNRFLAMTGSKPLLCHNATASFKLTRNQSKANYMQITLNGLDLYDLKFTRIHNGNLKVMKEVNNIYNDQLEQTFTEVTGLYTRLI